MEHFSDNLSNDEKEIEKELLVLSQIKNQFSHVSSVKQFSGILLANYIDRIPNIAFCAEIYIDNNNNDIFSYNKIKYIILKIQEGFL